MITEILRFPLSFVFLLYFYSSLLFVFLSHSIIQLQSLPLSLSFLSSIFFSLSLSYAFTHSFWLILFFHYFGFSFLLKLTITIYVETIEWKTCKYIINLILIYIEMWKCNLQDLSLSLSSLVLLLSHLVIFALPFLPL